MNGKELIKNDMKTKMNSFFLVLTMTALLHDPICAMASGDHIAQQAYLKASNTKAADEGEGPGDQFGRWVAVSGDTVVVGANEESSSATGVNGNQRTTTPIAPARPTCSCAVEPRGANRPIESL